MAGDDRASSDARLCWRVFRSHADRRRRDSVSGERYGVVVFGLFYVLLLVRNIRQPPTRLGLFSLALRRQHRPVIKAFSVWGMAGARRITLDASAAGYEER